MKHVFFKPWIGKKYSTGCIFNKKILVLGEYLYCGGCSECGLKYSLCCNELTTELVVKKYLSGYTDKWTAAYKKFERSLVNKETTNKETQDIWDSIAFFNFLQIALSGPRKTGSKQDYIEGQRAFLEVINELKPEVILVWGVTRLYHELPSKDWTEGDEYIVDDYHVKNGYYELHDGSKAKVLFVYNPSAGYSWSWWYKVISPYI